MKICVDGPEIENFSFPHSLKFSLSNPCHPNVCPYGKRQTDFNDDVVMD